MIETNNKHNIFIGYDLLLFDQIQQKEDQSNLYMDWDSMQRKYFSSFYLPKPLRRVKERHIKSIFLDLSL